MSHTHKNSPEEVIGFSLLAAIIILIILISIYLLILTPLSIYYARKVWILSKRKIPFFTQRHPKVVLINVLLFNIYVIIMIITDLLSLTVYHQNDNMLLTRLMMANLSQSLSVAVSMRIWLLYYDYTRGVKSLEIKLKQSMDHDHEYKHWILKYQFLSSYKFLWCLTCFIGLIFSLMSIIAYIFVDIHLYSYLQSVALLPAFLIIFLTFKIRECRDEFAILKEFRLTAFGILFAICLYLIIIIPFFSDYPHSILRLIITNIILCFSAYYASLISTYWVVYKYNLQIIKYNKLRAETVESDNHINMSLDDILSTKDGFDLLAAHLVKEFSIENLLFLFELIQIKTELIDNDILNESECGVLLTINYTTIRKLAREGSSIKNITELMINLKYIIEQYIYCDSELCINISFRTRQIILSEFSKKGTDLHTLPKFEWINHQNKRINSDNTLVTISSSLQNSSSLHKITPQFQWIQSDELHKLEQTKIKTTKQLMCRYIQSFDKAMQEIIKLLNGDTLLRFYGSCDYQRVLENYRNRTRNTC